MMRWVLIKGQAYSVRKITHLKIVKKAGYAYTEKTIIGSLAKPK